MGSRAGSGWGAWWVWRRLKGGREEGVYLQNAANQMVRFLPAGFDPLFFLV